jgi:hypothetical protein
MMKWGKTCVGRQRWMCSFCKKSGIKIRQDITRSAHQKLFTSWLVGTHSLSDIAYTKHVSRQTLHSWFTPFWKESPEPRTVALDDGILVVDAISLRGRRDVVLIGRTLTRIIYWTFAEHENYDSWKEFFMNIQSPQVVVCDGRRGLLQALKEVYPDVTVQRCIIHIVRYARSLLTQKPRYEAGKKLSQLIIRLLRVRTRRQKRRWKRQFLRWCKKYERFLSERTYGEEKKRSWWYTHKKLRTIRTLILHALPNIFTFIGHHPIPRTTNHVEGGINNRAKELRRRHRGLPLEKQQVMISLFLSSKQGKKPTRNFT